MSRPELPNPDNLPENRARLEREFRDALRTGGMHIFPQRLLDELVDVATCECIELRSRIASKIIGPIIGRYEVGGEGGISDEKLEFLATVVEYHYEDDDGNIQLIPEAIPPAPKR